MMVFLKKTIYTEKAFIDGTMVENLEVHMLTILWKDTAYSLGKMDENTLVDIRAIKNADTEHLSGQMG